mmetsp:Transcript_35966/g.60592  ORF Transcript_35966/g.60592 Transcript_35966/m.60592 type:complete len:229 (-) Transcript_35966:494-1180(-)
MAHESTSIVSPTPMCPGSSTSAYNPMNPPLDSGPPKFTISPLRLNDRAAGYSSCNNLGTSMSTTPVLGSTHVAGQRMVGSVISSTALPNRTFFPIHSYSDHASASSKMILALKRSGSISFPILRAKSSMDFLLTRCRRNMPAPPIFPNWWSIPDAARTSLMAVAPSLDFLTLSPKYSSKNVSAVAIPAGSSRHTSRRGSATFLLINFNCFVAASYFSVSRVSSGSEIS